MFSNCWKCSDLTVMCNYVFWGIFQCPYREFTEFDCSQWPGMQTSVWGPQTFQPLMFSPCSSVPAISGLFRNAEWPRILCGVSTKLLVCLSYFIALFQYHNPGFLKKHCAGNVFSIALVACASWKQTLGVMGGLWYFCHSFVALLFRLYLCVFSMTKCDMHF